jgi:hypothetical protein
MGRNSYFLVLVFVFISCSSSDDQGSINPANDSLSSLVAVNQTEVDNIIACASSSVNENEVIVYFYPRTGVTDIRYFETANVNANKNNYANYVRVDLQAVDIFNGYLKKFSRTTSEEKWVIISFMENGILHLSNPIRLKHRTQNTDFSDVLTITETIASMPLFSWEASVSPEDAIYFQVVSNARDELLSGTYTIESRFQYYKTDNVVLNITQGIPPSLIAGANYNFTLMGVSADNWVNTLIEKSFTVE